MLQRDAAIELIKQYISACKLINVNFYKVILYGSYANNTFHEDSDIDLALVSDAFSDDRIENRKKYQKQT
jgi:predicted nucleotidyltransferase